MTKLHLGCGAVHLEGWVNIDQRYQPGVDKIDNVGILQHWEVGSIEAIYACHVIDHFSRWDYKRVLARWHELLKPDGKLYVSTPDFAAITYAYSKGTSVSRLIGALYASQDYPGNHRHVVFDLDSLTSDLLAVGFRQVEECQVRADTQSHCQDCSEAKIPCGDGTTLVSLNVEAIK